MKGQMRMPPPSTSTQLIKPIRHTPLKKRKEKEEEEEDEATAVYSVVLC
jgi:hypothetical protein